MLSSVRGITDLRSARAALSHLRRCERGLSLTELLVSITLLGIVITTLVTLFTSGANAEAQLNLQFQSQSAARVALDTLRRDVHNACSATVTGSTTVTLVTLDTAQPGSQCSVTSVSWCTSGSGSQYGLYRALGSASCSSADEQRADFLTGGSIFSLQTATGVLPKVAVSMTVNVRPTVTRLQYVIDDAIALRSARRT